MPKYDVAFEDGTVVTVDAPEGANQTQIGMLALDQLDQMRPAQPPVPFEQPVSAPAPAATMPPPRA